MFYLDIDFVKDCKDSEILCLRPLLCVFGSDVLVPEDEAPAPAAGSTLPCGNDACRLRMVGPDTTCIE